MKSKITFLLAIVVLAACSTPKYAYYFDHRNNNTAKNKPADASPLAVDPQQMVASTSSTPVDFSASESEETAVVAKTYMQMTKSERKMLRHQLKSEFKSFVSVKKSDGTQSLNHTAAGMDNDLKLAAIFGAVGIVGLIIGGNVFNIIGGISLLIGVVFFVKWLIRQ